MGLGDWIWIGAGAVVVLGAAVLIAWSLLGDGLARIRQGRTRRCPRCWYSMEGTTGRKCPECGREAKSERRMLRCRRRWGLAAAGALVACAGGAAIAWPLSAGGAWRKWIPDTALIVMLPWTDEIWPLEELHDRTYRFHGPLWWYPRRRFDAWQWRLLQSRLLAVCESDAPVANRRRAMNMVALSNPAALPIDRVAAALRRWLEDPDPKIRESAAFVLDRLRYELGAERDACVAALEAADAGGGRWTKEFIELALRRVPAVPPEEFIGQQPGDSLTPQALVETLEGASGRDAVVAMRDLGVVARRIFLQPYDGEAGPLQVSRFDLDLDGRAGMDAVVRVGDQHGLYWQFSLFRRDGSAWRFIDVVGTASNSYDAPIPRIERAADNRRWLVVACGGRNGQGDYGHWQDAWLRITPRGVHGALDTGPGQGGFIAMRSVSADNRFVDASHDSTLTILDADQWPAAFEYEFRAQYRLDPARLSSPPDAPAPPAPIVLFEDSGRIRFRWSGAASALVIDPAHSTWTVDDTYAVAWDEPDAFLERHFEKLRELAGSEDPWIRAWLEELLGACSESAEKAELAGLLGERNMP
ncbi:MAG: hypothetical protein ACF8R7_18225 [Phycisphaerales bacterium JB039]